MRGSARLHQGLRTPKSHRNPWAAAFKAPLAFLDFEGRAATRTALARVWTLHPHSGAVELPHSGRGLFRLG